jgi:hypothetical protein
VTENNEAAERLLDQLLREYRMTAADKRAMVSDALAAERRAMVERILTLDPNRLAVCGQDGVSEWVPNARAILDEVGK